MTPADMLHELARDRDQWEAHVRHDPDERQYALVHRDEHLEVYVVCWMDGHDTGFHDHDASAAAIAVVEGAIHEERLSLDGPVGAVHEKGSLVDVPAEAIHRVRHAGHGPAVTLHAYSPPLTRVGTYEIAAGGTLVRYAKDADVPLAAPLLTV